MEIVFYFSKNNDIVTLFDKLRETILNILIIDPINIVAPYENSTLKSKAMGGTEATIIRVANGLATRHNVYVAQRRRKVIKKESATLSYIPWNDITKIKKNKIDNVIIVRSYDFIEKFRKEFNDTNLFLWMHDNIQEEMPNKEVLKIKNALEKNHCKIIAVSKSHQNTIQKHLNLEKEHVIFIYNPIDDALSKQNNDIDYNKILFLSTPSKGLDQTLEIFQKTKKTLPNIKFYIANPGYQKLFKIPKIIHYVIKKIKIKGLPTIRSNLIKDKRISYLGPMPHEELMEITRDACCIFYPQTKVAETFGLIYAEANAVGTPVLAHDFGSASEVLGNQEQLTDGSDHELVIDKLYNWSHNKKRPCVFANEQLKLTNVIKRWEEILS